MPSPLAIILSLCAVALPANCVPLQDPASATAIDTASATAIDTASASAIDTASATAIATASPTAIATASQTESQTIGASANPAEYAPVPAGCPAGPLVRGADRISGAESAYINGRKSVAGKALASWLTKVDSTFDTSANMPVLGFTSSGGGFRAFLASAGAIQGFDGRDTADKIGGLWQGVSYHVGLSGGAWLVTALAANGWDTISNQMTKLWSDSLFWGTWETAGARTVRYAKQLWAKKQAGFRVEIADIWGATLSDMVIYDFPVPFSEIINSSQWSSYDGPFPIVTATGVDPSQDVCYPATNAAQYEISPVEFGSWDTSVHSFAETKYIGSTVAGGIASKCVTGFDNMAYVLGTVANLFNGRCNESPATNIPQFIMNLLKQVEGALSFGVRYAWYPNPFFGGNSSTQLSQNVSQSKSLSLVDAGETRQNNPIWPMIQPGRPIDVVIVNDISGDTDGYPNGTAMHQSYQNAKQAGLSRMPDFPDPSEFTPVARRPWFFGCNKPDQVTLIYLPNTNFTMQSNVSTYKLQYDKQTSANMISNGAAVASQGGDAQWPVCLACGIMQKTGSHLPDACKDCLDKYCYYK